MSVSNTVALRFTLGWQRGTVYEVADALGVCAADILDADEARMDVLLQLAQVKRSSPSISKPDITSAYKSALGSQESKEEPIA